MYNELPVTLLYVYPEILVELLRSTWVTTTGYLAQIREFPFKRNFIVDSDGTWICRIGTDSSQINWPNILYLRLYRVNRNDCRGFNNCHLVLQMQPHMISFCGVASRIRFMFLLFPQISRNWRYESEPPLKPSPLTSYKQFGTNSIIVLMFVESQRVNI